ncbi:hypothetical protein [Streptacidiphilus cavernicola]|uniref:Uncharacterized protein n=1 Tax=Streptacidiphilus cavernicola TaxID=3342716 RepID=A0ABV6VY85_9ACTN
MSGGPDNSFATRALERIEQLTDAVLAEQIDRYAWICATRRRGHARFRAHARLYLAALRAERARRDRDRDGDRAHCQQGSGRAGSPLASRKLSDLRKLASPHTDS